MKLIGYNYYSFNCYDKTRIYALYYLIFKNTFIIIFQRNVIKNNEKLINNHLDNSILAGLK